MFAAFIRLFRVPNLALLVVTIYLIAQRVIYPPLIQNQILSQLTPNELYLILFLVICIGGGGYLYNDVVDVEADLLNGRKVVINHAITRHFAMFLYLFITIAPLVAVFSLVIELGRPAVFWGYVILVFIFWLYNQVLQSIALAGNITVALLCAVGVLLPFYLEHPSLEQLLTVDPLAYDKILKTILFFSSFAFTANLCREIVKDIEDIAGDQRAQQITLPILVGIEKSKRTILFIMSLLSFSLIYFVVTLWPLSMLKLILLITLLLLPLGLLGWLTMKANQKEDFSLISQLWKVYFGCGLLTIIFVT